MAKPLRADWFLEHLVRQEVERLAAGLPIVPVVQRDDEKIVRDEECKGFGRAPWICQYFIPPNHPARAMVPVLNAAIAPLQARYDLGFTWD